MYKSDKSIEVYNFRKSKVTSKPKKGLMILIIYSSHDMLSVNFLNHKDLFMMNLHYEYLLNGEMWDNLIHTYNYLLQTDKII